MPTIPMFPRVTLIPLRSVPKTSTIAKLKPAGCVAAFC